MPSRNALESPHSKQPYDYPSVDLGGLSAHLKTKSVAHAAFGSTSDPHGEVTFEHNRIRPSDGFLSPIPRHKLFHASMDCIGSFRSSGLNMGVPPCKSISLVSTRSKFDLACYYTVAYAVNRLHLFKPLSESEPTPPVPMKFKGWLLGSLPVQQYAFVNHWPEFGRLVTRSSG
ncbi:hypothetical protein Tco_0774438 [Tanacetum coccineum]|uniref:Uncharacterized protein n=1 Tax=Tanacetum coccineum TaxID=301880 RepID=A0ABQ4ZPI1_9ASTR